METRSITFTKQEVAVISPALEDMVAGLFEAGRGRYPRQDTTSVPYHGQEVYRERRFDDEMHVHVLSCRNKLKFKGASKEVRLNAFELAAAALAFRVVREEELVPNEMLTSPLVAGLERKLENARKRAKRAAIKQTGLALYKEESDRWTHFVEWMRYNLLYYRPRRKSYKQGTLFYKEQRDALRALAMQVVVAAADQQQVHHLADLARRELRRRRHVEVSPTLRALLKDHEKARQFLAMFILKRGGPDILFPEFQPLCVRMANRAERLTLALCIDAD